MRLEYWDTATETAWTAIRSAPATRASRRLGRLAEHIAQVRGAPVECLGSTDLAERDAHGATRPIMQADELAYLHPACAKLPRLVLTIRHHRALRAGDVVAGTAAERL